MLIYVDHNEIMELQHSKMAQSEWATLQTHTESGKPVLVDGQTLSVSGVIAVAM